MDLLGDLDDNGVACHPLSLSDGSSKALSRAPSRRPPPPPPSSTAAGDESSFVPVDNMGPQAVEALFNESDADGDGRLNDAEVRAFFSRTGLSEKEAAVILAMVKPGSITERQSKDLTRRRFSQALRLVALAQSGKALTPELAQAAMEPDTWTSQDLGSLPAPQIGPLGSAPTSALRQTPSGNPFRDSEGPEAALPAQFDGPAADLGAVFGPVGPPPVDDDDDIFNLASLKKVVPSAVPSAVAEPAAAIGPEVLGEGVGSDGAPVLEGGGVSRIAAGASRSGFARSKAMTHSPSELKGSKPSVSASAEPPLAYELRYPPLNPKVSAKLSILAAANGSLFAGPATTGGVLQWARPEDDATEPSGSGMNATRKRMFGRLDSDLRVTNIAERSVASEDHDAAPSREASITQKGKPATCLLADTLRGLLWAGDRDGWVSAYDISHTPGTALDPASAQLHSWHAHRVGHVAAMTVGPTGELWTASSRGSIRTWRHTASSPAKDSSSKIMMEAILPPKARELRRGTGERAHSGPVLALACSSDGQIIWSASARSVVLWDSSSGAYLGMLQRSGGLGGSTTGSTVNLSDFYSSKVVNSAKGLDVDELTGAVLVRPGAAERAKWHAQQEAWAAQSDRGVAELAERLSEGAGKAVKFMGKLGMRLAGIGGSSVSSTAAERYPPPSQHSAPSLSIDTDEATLGDGALPGSITGTSTGKVGGDVVALVASPQNVMWVGYREGRVERYSAAGQYLGACDVAGRIQTMARVGLHMWVGMTNGVLCVLGPDGGGLKSFLAQRAGIVSIAQAGSRTFSLAADGSISGWSSAVPSVADTEALTSWRNKSPTTYTRQSLHALAVTWNCGESRPQPQSTMWHWLHQEGFGKDLVVIGLQEVEMGGTSVALAVAKDALSYKLQERGNANAQFWSSFVLDALSEKHFHQVALRQLSGMLIMVFARNNLRGHIGEIATASVACGVLGVGGNKGAVAVQFTLYRQKIALVCSHFAAHQGAVEARNANYCAIARGLTFNRRAWFSEDELETTTVTGTPGGAPNTSLFSSDSKTRLPSATTELSLAESDKFFDAESSLRHSDGEGDSASDEEMLEASTPLGPPGAAEELLQGEGLRSAAAVVWVGDFNYRIEGDYDFVRKVIDSRDLHSLLECDQLQNAMKAGKVFSGMREPPITFPPTYKFDKGSTKYDSSEKRRVPSWCDRILFRGSVPFQTPFPTREELLSAPPPFSDGEVRVTATDYRSWGDVLDSDHRPVCATLEISLPVTDAAKKRALVSALLAEHKAPSLALAHAIDGPQATLSTDAVRLHAAHMPEQMVLLSNGGAVPLEYAIVAVDDGTLSPGDVAVEVRPVRGVVQPHADAPIHVSAVPRGAGDAGAYVAGPQEVQFRVTIGTEYSAGGAGGKGVVKELHFTALVLPEFAQDDKF